MALVILNFPAAFLLASIYCIARKKPGKKHALGAICEGEYKNKY